LNQIVAGGDYGWDAVAGMWSGEGIMTPIAEWTPAIAPSGIAILNDPASLWDGDVFLNGLVGQQLVRVVLTPTPRASGSRAAACTESLLSDDYGRLRALRTGPDGSLYLTTSNRDQRGMARENDDLLLRIVPPRVDP
jgi:glucose/arabinose dehydrogenase